MPRVLAPTVKVTDCGPPIRPGLSRGQSGLLECRPGTGRPGGGNGPDYEACVEALERRRDLTLDTSVRFLRGHFYGSPPVYLPPLDETYRRVR